MRAVLFSKSSAPLEREVFYLLKLVFIGGIIENKLYVGNISYTTKESDLENLFAQAGAVKSVSIITDRSTGRSKGFAFVEMGSDEEARKAIEILNGKELNERAINVSIARPREERGSFGSGGRGRSSGGRGRSRNW